MRTYRECEALGAKFAALAGQADQVSYKRELEDLAKGWTKLAAYARWQDSHGLRNDAIEALGETLRFQAPADGHSSRLAVLAEDIAGPHKHALRVGPGHVRDNGIGRAPQTLVV